MCHYRVLPKRQSWMKQPIRGLWVDGQPISVHVVIFCRCPIRLLILKIIEWYWLTTVEKVLEQTNHFSHNFEVSKQRYMPLQSAEPDTHTDSNNSWFRSFVQNRFKPHLCNGWSDERLSEYEYNCTNKLHNVLSAPKKKKHRGHIIQFIHLQPIKWQNFSITKRLKSIELKEQPKRWN